MNTFYVKPFTSLYVVIISLLLILSSDVVAGGLYAPTVKDNEGLVRLLNLSSANASFQIEQSSRGVNKTASMGFSSYVRIKAGEQSFQVVGTNLTLEINTTIMAKNRYTIVLTPAGKLTMVNDPRLLTKGKSMIRLYNFSDQKQVSLKTTNGTTTIIKQLESGQVGSRQINAVSLAMAIYMQDKPLHETKTQLLLKDTVKNIAIIDNGVGIVVLLANSHLNTRI